MGRGPVACAHGGAPLQLPAVDFHSNSTALVCLNKIEHIVREVREEVLGAVRPSDLKMCTAVLRAIGDRLEGNPDVGA